MARSLRSLAAVALLSLLAACGDDTPRSSTSADTPTKQPPAGTNTLKPGQIPDSPRIENDPALGHVGGGFTGLIRFENFKVEFPFVQLGAVVDPTTKSIRVRLLGQTGPKEHRDRRSFVVQWHVPAGELESLDGLSGKTYSFDAQDADRNAFFGRQVHHLVPLEVTIEQVTADTLSGRLESKLVRRAGGTPVIFRGTFRARRGAWIAK